MTIRRKGGPSARQLLEQATQLTCRHDLGLTECELREQANNIARATVANALANLLGVQYGALSFDGQMHINEAIQELAADNVAALGDLLMPITEMLIRAELEQETIEESAGYRSHRDRMKASVNTARTRLHRSRSAKTGASYLKGHGPQSHARAASRMAVLASLKIMGKGSGNDSPTNQRLVSQMSALFRDGSKTPETIRKLVSKNKRRSIGKARMTKGNSKISSTSRSDFGAGILQNSYEVEGFHDMLFEADMSKFEALYLRGLIPMQQIAIYKRVFGDMEKHIKYRAFQPMFIKMLNRLIDMITKDKTIYTRVLAILQKEKINGKG